MNDLALIAVAVSLMMAGLGLLELVWPAIERAALAVYRRARQVAR